VAGRIPEEKILEVQAASDILEVIQRYMPLKRAGKNWKALCPFHEEKTPSFVVFPETQTFKCFGCGKAGTVFTYVQDRENIPFPEAVRMLARDAGVAIAPLRDDGRENEREEVYRITEWACRRYQTWLADEGSGGKARTYLKGRGITGVSARDFRLGYAPPGWHNLLREAAGAGIRRDALVRAGLAVEGQGGKTYDRFRDRIVFPICDVRDRPIAFGGRGFEGDVPKYLNSPETVVFTKGRGVYGLNRARGEGGETDSPLAVVEGYTDVIMAHQVGFRRAVATLGTAMTAQQARLLRRYTKEVVLIFDADDAGRAAAERGAAVLLAEGIGVRVGFLPEGQDPFDLCRREGSAGLARIVDAAREILDHKLDAARRRHDLGSVRGRAEAAREVVATIAAAGDALLVSAWVRRAAEELGLDEGALRQELARSRDGGSAARPAPRGVAGAAEKAARGVLRGILVGQQAVPEDLVAEDFPAGECRGVFEAVAALQAGGRDVSVAALTAAAGEATGAFAADVVASDAGEMPEAGYAESLAYLRTVRTTRGAERVKQEMKAAAVRGDDEAYERLSGEFLALRRALETGKRAKESVGE
jgi:DNA primase